MITGLETGSASSLRWTSASPIPCIDEKANISCVSYQSTIIRLLNFMQRTSSLFKCAFLKKSGNYISYL